MNKNTDFEFSRFERNGILFLSLLIILSIACKRFIVQAFTSAAPITKNDAVKIAQLEQQIATAKIEYQYQKSDKYSSNDAIKKEYTSKAYKFPQNKFFTIEINSATVEDFEKLNGIGKVYANRIVTFRNKLGGFHSIEQIKHVFGIEDSVFQKFKRNLTVKPINPKKININQATFEELTANPYFFSTVAKQIIGYRTKVKPFSTIEDVKNLYFVKDHPEHYDKMLPYIAID
ncbi:MAG: helix-hairpin-helix domain-containing protein [Chitinophagales bacterium]|jgi:competence ComEA-like helix-hairpin-helix protein|nr:helix-hairpin-helix domain-containing protein [Chitinophagales bacterium]